MSCTFWMRRKLLAAKQEKSASLPGDKAKTTKGCAPKSGPSKARRGQEGRPGEGQ